MLLQRAYHRTSRAFRLLTLTVTLCFALLVLIAPAFHTHASSGAVRALPLLSAPALSGTGSAAHSAGAESVVHIGKTAKTAADTCLLCQFLCSGLVYTFTPVCLLVFALAVSALLVLAVRLAALCARPAPRRGLRAPPAFALAV